MQIFAARHVLPVAAPPLRDGAVAVEAGTIVAVGPRVAMLERFGRDAEFRDLGSAALLPGLVNAHCHVELSWMGEDPPPGGDYVAWVRGLLERRAAEDPDLARRSAERAIAGMAARGTVALADVANATWIVPLLRRSLLRGVVFHEIYGGWPGGAERLDAALARIADLGTGGEPLARRWRVVPTPHAPHTTSAALLRALGRRAAERADPLSVHVAESAAETALLADGSGPLFELLRERALLDSSWRPPGRTPVEHLDRLGALGRHTLAVHCVHVGRRERAILQARGTHVVTCPRSNERLGVGTAAVPTLLADGIPVALGTDSRASAPDLDLFAEMAALRRIHPRLSPATVLRMATLNGAAALGLAERLGSIGPGRLADLVVVPLAAGDDAPLDTVCSGPQVVHRLEEAPYAGGFR